jgi:guanine deaminase
MHTEDETLLRLAVTLAEANVKAGGGPFGAVIANANGIVATGVNRVTVRPDPTAHAEVEAIRAAAEELGRFDLTGCVLYASCEPCPMCAAAAHWARVDRVVYAATSQHAADAGFDDDALWAEMSGRTPRTTPVERHDLDMTSAPFDAWSAHNDRTHY